MRLVPAEIVARTDIDDADGDLGGAARGLPVLDATKPAAVPCRNSRREIFSIVMLMSSPLDAAKCG